MKRSPAATATRADFGNHLAEIEEMFRKNCESEKRDAKRDRQSDREKVCDSLCVYVWIYIQKER